MLGDKPLIYFVQKNLLSVKEIDEIYCYCSDERIKEYLFDGVNFLKRPKSLDSSTATSNDILTSFIKEITADIYVFSMATAPFVKPESFSIGIEKVKSGEYDSAFSVELLQEFIWQNGIPVNFSLDNIPRTQDLPKLYIESSGFYVFTHDVVKNGGRRVGNKPYNVEVSKFEATDIDYPEDFELANIIYKEFILKNGTIT